MKEYLRDENTMRGVISPDLQALEQSIIVQRQNEGFVPLSGISEDVGKQSIAS